MLTVTDLFCGAGGSSIGAEAAGLELRMAANHWQTAIEVHQANFPNAAHDLADISQADPRRYPVTDVLLASPECTNHSQARGVSRRSQASSLFDDPDPSAERSRATMWDVIRFAEQIKYSAIVVENVVEATKWVLWPSWCQAMDALGYRFQVLSHNSQDHGVAQSRDRIYVVAWRRGLRPDLEMERPAHCTSCNTSTQCRQGFANGRTVGRYRQAWRWYCTSCGAEATPSTTPAAEIIDWELPTPRIGDRARPLADNTRARILAGLERFGWTPITTTGAGNGHERTPGNRARSLDDTLPTQHTTATTALALPPGFLVQTRHSHDEHRRRVYDPADPHPTICASDDRLSLIVPLRRHAHAQPTSQPIPAVTASGNHHGLLMRNNKGGAEMLTPVTEPARTLTSTGAQSLVMPERVVDDCGFRMLEPHEIAAAMAFPVGYIPDDLPKKDRVKLAGNAVTPPVMQWITGRLAQAIESAA